VDDDPQNERWVEKILKTFGNAYRRAPEFARVFPIVEADFRRPTNRVAELAVMSLKSVADFLDIRTEWVETSTGYDNSQLKATDRVLAICQAEGAKEYVNVAGGRDLYSRDRFETEGVRLNFVQPRPLEYPQFRGPFVPWLSIVDVLMFNPRDTVRTFLDAYDLT